MKVLVTGGAGFIGSHVIDRLLYEGFEVVVLDNFFSGKRENLTPFLGKSNFRLVEGDIRDKAKVKNALNGVHVVFHLASIVSVDLSLRDPILVNDVNVYGTLNVLEGSLKANVEKFIYASSCAVYGEPLYLPIDEEHPTRPVSPYGVSKLAAEHYCRVFYKNYGLQTISLRLFNVYGRRQTNGVIKTYINRLKRGEIPVIYGDKTKTRDFIYVKDVIEAFISAIKYENCIGDVINVGSGVETPIYRLAELLIELFGLRNVNPIYAQAKAGDINRSCANISKAKKLLHFNPMFSLKEGLVQCLGNVN